MKREETKGFRRVKNPAGFFTYLKPGKNNKEDRMNFVKYWAEYVRTHPDKDWSRQQKVLIDSQIKNAQELKIITPRQYLEIKKKG